MKLSRFLTTFCTILAFLWTANIIISAQELPSKWYFGKGYNDKLSKNWANDGIAATDYGKGILRIVKADGTPVDSSLVVKSKPIAGPVNAGDYILFEFPETKLEAGSFTVRSNSE